MASLSLKLGWLTVLGALYYFLIHPFIFPTKYKPSQYLLDIVHYLDFVKTFNEDTIRMLNEDPFGDLVNEVRPTLDDMGSLKAQISKYEQMDLEKGAPQHFIKSATERVDKILDNVLAFEEKYRLILHKMQKNTRRLMEVEMPRFASEMTRVLETQAHELGDFKLYFQPDDLKQIREYTKSVNIDFIKQIVLKLSRYFAEVEKLYPDYFQDNLLTVFSTNNPDIVVIREKGHEAVEEIERFQKFTEISEKLMELTKDHGDSTLHGVSVYVIQTDDQIKNRVPLILDHLGRCKERYEKLVDGIDFDVTSSRDRIHNLHMGKSRPKVEEL